MCFLFTTSRARLKSISTTLLHRHKTLTRKNSYTWSMQDGVEHINPEILVFNRIELLCHTELTGCCKLLHCLKCNFIDNLSTSPLLGASDCNNCGEKSALPGAVKYRCYFIKCRRYCQTVSYDRVLVLQDWDSCDSCKWCVSRLCLKVSPGHEPWRADHHCPHPVQTLSKPQQIYSFYQEINTSIRALQQHCFEDNCSSYQL